MLTNTVPSTWQTFSNWSKGSAPICSDVYVMGKENATRTTLKGIFKMTFLCLQLYRQLLRLLFFQHTILPFSFSKITSLVISKPISVLRLGRGISLTSCPLLQKNFIGCLTPNHALTLQTFFLLLGNLILCNYRVSILCKLFMFKYTKEKKVAK